MTLKLRTVSRAALLVALLAVAPSGWAAEPPASADIELARMALVQDAAAEQLRAMGPAALDAFRAAHGEVPSPTDVAGPEADDLRAAYDRVAGQRDAWSSHLYWYSSDEAAIAEAQRTGRPILSLQMLGKLTDDLSCANSRFFRTALYANTEVSTYLRDNFVLIWDTVRPVPLITIDFGDGRTLERTITGNSAHLVLDKHGRPVDALPGLYGPTTFLRVLEEARVLAVECGDAATDGERREKLTAWHGKRADELATKLAAARYQSARAAAATTQPLFSFAKSIAESPSFRAVGTKDPSGAPTDELVGDWEALAERLGTVEQIDQGSRRVIAAKQAGDPDAAMRLALSKVLVEDPLARLTRNFERTLSADTALNEYELHPRIHRWFAEGDVGSYQAFTSRIYAEVFLMPSADMWQGLAPRDTYSGLDKGGLAFPAVEGLIPIQPGKPL